MKKHISKSKVQRMRNLVTGDYTNKTQIRSGYTKESMAKHIEGDVWENNGKTWTIKNGIKQTVTKLDKARAMAKIPLHCPKCDSRMLADQHKYMYKRFKHCLHCQTDAEMEMRSNGTYDAWQNSQINRNFEGWLHKSRAEFKDWLETRGSKTQISEAGDIEDWSGGKSDDELLAEFDVYIENEKLKLTNITG